MKGDDDRLTFLEAENRSLRDRLQALEQSLPRGRDPHLSPPPAGFLKPGLPTATVDEDLRLFRNLVDRLHDSIFFLAAEDGRVLYVNDAACRTLSYPREELLGMRLWDFSESVASLADWREIVARIGREDSALFETRHRCRDGNYLDMEVHAAAVEMGSQRFMVGVARDVTHRKLTEARVMAERNQVGAIMAALGDGITVIDRDFRIIYQNEVILGRWGNHLGERCHLIYAKREVPCEFCQVEKSFADGRIHRWQHTSQTLQGTRQVEVTACPLLDDEGNIAACIEAVRDITEQKRMEQELQESNEKYRLLFSAESDAILTYDAETWEIQEVNETACAVYGLMRWELIGRRWPDLVAGSEEEVSSGLRASVHRRGDGSLFPVELSSGLFRWQGRPMVVAVVRDITERRRLEQSREEVLSLISHEMRTPLTAILGCSEYLLENEAAPGVEKEFLGMIVKQSERLKDLIDNLLCLQRFQAGFGLEDPGPVGIPVLLQEVVESLRTPLVQQTIEFECCAALPPVFGEAKQIQHAVKNLLGNALKYSPPDSRIILGAQADGGSALLWVRDEGPGIPAEEQEKIFDRFYRATGPRSPAGTGLGLALVREVASAHGGRTWVESSPGQGSTFYLSLPFAS